VAPKGKAEGRDFREKERDLDRLSSKKKGGLEVN